MPDQRISLGQGEAVVREFSINSVTSRLKLECDIFSPEEEQYLVEMADMRGNKFSYSLVKKEGEQFTFQNDGALAIALDSEWLDVQIYALPYDEENEEAIDFRDYERRGK